MLEIAFNYLQEPPPPKK